MAGCSNSKLKVNSPTFDYTEVDGFVREKYAKHMKTLNIQSYNITNTSIASRVEVNDKHFVCIIEADIIKTQDKPKEKYIYDYDIATNDNRNFQILHEGTNVDSTYLQVGP
jgi:hypothetical protein